MSNSINSGIYIIMNLVNGKFYIGSSSNLRNRKKEHYKTLKSNTHANRYLQRSYNKYGKENLKFEIVEYIENDDSKLLEREQYYLDIYYGDTNYCYNICSKTGSVLGVKHSRETRLNNSISKGGKPFYVFKNKNFIGEYINIAEFSIDFNISYKRIYSGLKEKGFLLDGYAFIYKDNYSEDKLNEIYNKMTFVEKHILVYKKSTKEFIGEFDSAKICMDFIKIKKFSFYRCLKSKSKSTKGYIIIYKNEYSDDLLNYLYNYDSFENYYKPFYIFDKNNKEFIGEYKSQSEFKRIDTKNYNVNECLKGKVDFCNNFILIYKEDYTEDKLNEIYNRINKYNCTFEVYNKTTNELIGTYNDISLCAKELDIKLYIINNYLIGKIKHIKNYIFKVVS